MNGALTKVVLRGEGRSEEVNLVGVCGGLFTDRDTSRCMEIMFTLDKIGLDLFGLVQLSLVQFWRDFHQQCVKFTGAIQ